jgi:eukaryotic-like serine/threonine-protein kinase
MPLAPGTRLGPYVIEAPIGAGGMGEVYRSRDVRLDRTVALKVLPSHFASDPDLRQRFEREARSIAALSHPHICALYDVGEAPNPESHQAPLVQFLVMEYLEGETLAEALQRKPLPIPEVLRTSIEIADAIDKAHRKGVVHRDLKPGNIMLTSSGTKLLDFGLAKVQQPSFSSLGMTATASTPLTDRGTVLGTPNYMAPEQVEGKEADHRSDIFALGAIIYEMTTGRRAFEGSSPASVMAAILNREPPALTTLQPLASPLLDHVVTRCLAKNPDDRWQSAGDVMRELQWIAHSSNQLNSTAHQPPARSQWRWLLPVLAWAAIMTVLAAFLAVRPSSAPPPEQRLDITTPPTFDALSLAISPDGRKVVFVAASNGRSQLWLRYLNSTSVQPLAGTDSPQFPFWSPDSRSIGFGSSGWLKRIDLDGGAVRKLANAPLFLGGTWNTDGSILFVPNTNSRVFRISDGGGDPVAVTPPLDPEAHQHFPHVLPDGRHFLYYMQSAPETRGVYMAGIDGSSPRRVLDAEASAIYSRGRLLFLRTGKLWALRFDPSSGTVDGSPSEVVDQIANTVFAGARVLSVSASLSGVIAYRAGALPSPIRFDLKWMDRSGNIVDQIRDQSDLVMNPSLAPDERHMAMFWRSADIWLYDLTTKTPSRFTFDPANDFSGIWSPDGSRIVFCSNRSGVYDLYQKDATGAGGDQLLLATKETKAPTDWSADGKYVLFRSLNPKTTFDIWAFSIADHTSFPVAATPFEERDGQFSPDGKWVAYQSNESGRFEIWVRPFPVPGVDVKADERWQFTTDGGTQVRWGHDGKEIFYVAPDGRLMAMPVTVEPGGRAVSHGAPAPLFSVGVQPYGGGTALPWYMVSRDSKRFLTTTSPQPPAAIPITLLVNWKP